MSEDTVAKKRWRSKIEALKKEIAELIAKHNNLGQQKLAIEQEMNKTALKINGKQGAVDEFEAFLADRVEPKKSEKKIN